MIFMSILDGQTRFEYKASRVLCLVFETWQTVMLSSWLTTTTIYIYRASNRFTFCKVYRALIASHCKVSLYIFQLQVLTFKHMFTGVPQECEGSLRATNVSEYPLQLFNEVKLTNSFLFVAHDVCLVPGYQPRRIVKHKEVNLPPCNARGLVNCSMKFLYRSWCILSRNNFIISSATHGHLPSIYI